MKRDPLQAMLRIRQTAQDEARKALADAYAKEQAISRVVQQATEALDLEMRAAVSLAAGDEAVEMFARWLPLGRRRIAEAQTAQREATLSLDRLRIMLGLARAGVASVERLIEERRLAQQALRARKDQAVLDDIGSRRWTP